MTAHDPRVTLTEAEKLAMQRALNGPRSGSVAGMLLTRAVEQIIAARLDRVRAVAEQWDTGCAREVLAALDAPQDAEVAGGRSEGERAVCGRLYLDKDGDKDYCSWPAGHEGSCW